MWRITLDTNPEDCNATCIMCEEHSPYSDFIEKLYEKTGKRRRRMPVEWLDQIFSQAKQLGIREIIPSTMGEPLIYKYFEKILTLCKEHDLKLNLTTNGTFPRKTVEEWAELIVPVTSDVKFSWNGATAETYEKVMQGISFEKVMDHLERFIRVRDRHVQEGGNFCRVTLQLTFMEMNMHELPAMVQMAAAMGVNRVKGHHLWAHFEEIKEQNYRRDADSVARWNEIVAQTWEAQEKYRLPGGEKVLLENVYPLVFQENQQTVPEDHVCPFLDQELWISPTGKISPCCAPDALRQELGDFGNIQNRSLKEVIESTSYRQLVQNYRRIPLCQSCNMRQAPKN
ncbi:MAG: radical SAM protein [Bacteroidota bacterium]